MSIIQDVIPKTIFFGDLVRLHGLGMVPILTEEVPGIPTMDTLDEALDKGTVRITETSLAGEVPFLFLENTGTHPVIILDGEELLGGKQNRIINTTLIILEQTTVKIPVSCIQAGRWQSERADFASGKSIFRAKSRAVQKRTVTNSVRGSGSFRSDQGAVWEEVSQSLRDLGVRSETSNFEEARDRVAHRIEEFVTAITPLPNQIGSLFFSEHGVMGAELLGTPDLFSRCLEKIVRSFAFEVLIAPDLNRASGDPAKQWWAEVLASPFSKHKSLGVGDDIRTDALNLIGSGLLYGGTMIHFSSFPIVQQESNRPPGSTRASARQRRRNLRSSLVE